MKRTKQYAPKEIYNVVRDDVQAPAWSRNEWWYQQAAQLSERVCERNSDHGQARIFDHTNGAGRVLGYHCALCGWERAMLVYEGRDEPSAPAAPLPTKPKRFNPLKHEGNWRKRLSGAQGRKLRLIREENYADDDV